LKSALEKLPEAHPEKQPWIVSKLKPVLTPGELLMARQLEGTWTRLTRESEQLVIKVYCYASTQEVRVDILGEQVKVHLELGQDSDAFDVVGVELNNGSMVFKKWNGGTLKSALSREDKRVSSWTSSDYESLNGLFVHDSQKNAFPVVTPESCDDVDEQH
jgi:hypothetical protein